MDGERGSVAGARLWRLANVEYDERTGQLSVDGLTRPLEPIPRAFLQRLLEQGNAPVPRADLARAGWGQYDPSDASIQNAISKLRRSLGSVAGGLIESVRLDDPRERIGYRLLQPAMAILSPTALKPLFAFAEGDPVPARPPWRLAERLASQAANNVWVAVNPGTDERRVFKFAVTLRQVETLRIELALSRRLRDVAGSAAAFLPVIDADLDATPAWIESEYGGLDLERWAGRHSGLAAIPLAIRIGILADVAGAVARAHAVGVLHGNLCPANIMVAGTDDAPQVRLTDFGARNIGDDIPGFAPSPAASAAEERARNAIYLPPEAALGAQPTTGSDIYALGILLYQIVAGDFGLTPGPQWHTNVPDPLVRQDIAEAAADNPLDRLASAASLAIRLRTLEGRREARAEQEREQAWLERVRDADMERRRRRPWQIGIACAVVVTVLAICAAGIAAVRDRNVIALQKRAAEQTASVLENTVGALTTALADGLQDRSGVSVALISALLQPAQSDLAAMTHLLPGDVRLRRLQAVALMRFANTYLHEGDVTEATALIVQALGVQASLLRQRSGDLALVAEIADSQHFRGNIAIACRNIPEAMAAYQQELQLAREIVLANPHDNEASHKVGRAIHDLGRAQAEGGDYVTALATDRSAILMATLEMQTHPADTEWQVDLSTDDEGAAEVLDDQNKHAEALALYRADLKLREAAYARDRNNTRYARNLDIALGDTAVAMASLGDPRGALPYLEKARAISSSLVAIDESNQVWQRDLIVGLTNLGDEQANLNDLPAAIASYGQGIAGIENLLAKSPGDEQLRDDRIIGYNNIATYYSKIKLPQDAHASLAHAVDLFLKIPQSRRGDGEVALMLKAMRETAVQIGWTCDATERCAVMGTQRPGDTLSDGRGSNVH